MQRRTIAPRRDWKHTAEQHGFRFHTIDGAPYWDESAYYAFTLKQIENDIEDPSAELHGMAMALIADVVRSEAMLDALAIPPAFRDWIAHSWQARQPHLYGRLDLAYDWHGPAKLLELNYDTPTALYEAAYFQWLWLEQQLERRALPIGCDQFNSIQEKLIERFGELARTRRIASPLYFAAMRGAEEDQGTVTYLRDCALQAGLETRAIAIEDIGLSIDQRFTDLDDIVMRALFKLYPLEHLWVETFGAALPGSGLQLIEPPWKAIPSNKGFLSLLWDRHPGHPNLLPAEFCGGSPPPLPAGWVEKPLSSREGNNILLRLDDGRTVYSEGPDGEGPRMRQRCHPLPWFDGQYALVGSWIIGDLASGIGIREDATLITRNTSRFVPHVILP